MRTVTRFFGSALPLVLLACGSGSDAATDGASSGDAGGAAATASSSTRSSPASSSHGVGGAGAGAGAGGGAASGGGGSASGSTASVSASSSTSASGTGGGGGAPNGCSDGVKDGDETGVDCGGSCPPCGVATGGVPFVAGRSSLIGDPPASSWEPVDLNGDGKLDVVVKLTSFTTAFGNGDGVVATTGAFVANSFPLDVHGHGDFDGDGKGDVVGCFGNNGVVVFRGSATSPSGILEEDVPAFAFGPSAYLSACASADLDGDGKPDVVVGTASGTVEIALNTGTSLAPGAVYTGLTNVTSVVPFDVDGQHGPDLLALDANAARLELLVAKGDGTFTKKTPAAVPADVIEVAPFREVSGVSVALLVGAGALSVATLAVDGTLGAPAAVGTDTYQSVAAGDLVGDGSIEIVATRLLGGYVDIYARVAGKWSLEQSLRPNWLPEQVRLVDWDGDGKLDIAWLNGGSPVTLDVLLNQGGGVFPNPAVTALDAQPFEGGAFGDLNGDGRADALIAVDSIPNQSFVDVYLADAAGGFTKSVRAPISNQAKSLLVGEFSGDTKIDVAALDGLNRVTLLAGDGAGNLTAGATFNGPADAIALYVGDADGAGALDLFVPAPGGVVAYGRSGGFFGGTAHTVTPSAWPDVRVVADVDGDGKQDLVVSGLFSGGLAWARSHGAFTFDAPVQLGGNVNVYAALPLKLGALPRRWLVASDDGLHDWQETASGVVDTPLGGPQGNHIVRGDWNHDGIDDVIVAGAVIALYVGKADGTYAYTGTTLLGGGLANAVELADATGDGRKDIVVVNHYGGITTLAATP